MIYLLSLKSRRIVLAIGYIPVVKRMFHTWKALSFSPLAQGVEGIVRGRRGREAVVNITEGSAILCYMSFHTLL